MKLIIQFLSKEEGVTAIEYALIAALVAIAIIAALSTLGVNISTIFTTIANTV